MMKSHLDMVLEPSLMLLFEVHQWTFAWSLVEGEQDEVPKVESARACQAAPFVVPLGGRQR